MYGNQWMNEQVICKFCQGNNWWKLAKSRPFSYSIDKLALVNSVIFHNVIKCHIWSCLKLETLDVLTEMSSLEIELENMDWRGQCSQCGATRSTEQIFLRLICKFKLLSQFLHLNYYEMVFIFGLKPTYK